MQFSTVLVTFFAGLIAASPIIEERAFVCSNGLDTPQCCSLSVDGVAGLECEAPSPSPMTATSFTSICAASGKEAQCCTAVLDGVGVDCNSP
ncbi:Cryparin [Lachnellula suecica]|uniref:Cryparin n=1 Tax=Lachnellula suecica TaxID=602035 RepID=A0A8T9C5M8_9HELO|nr:Cryparin [Lachnellula suecica]